MAEASIPVDPFNPGQVFACLGFLEAAEVLLGDAEGGFDWTDEADVRFHLRARGEESPVAAVLRFLAEAEVVPLVPQGVSGPWPEAARESMEFPAPLRSLLNSEGKKYVDNSLPIILRGADDIEIVLTSWIDMAFGVESFKLFAGRQRSSDITKHMLRGNKRKYSSGVIHVLGKHASTDPFGCVHDAGVTPLAGRFGFDARGAWGALDIGFSIDEQDYLIMASPVVELLAAVGLENARPTRVDTYHFRYGVWATTLPVALARAALPDPRCLLPADECRVFAGFLGTDKQYKKCFFAEEETER